VALRWNGDRVLKMMGRANRIGINRTMAECVGFAKKNHPFTTRTTHAEKSISVLTPAVTDAKGTVGTWGSILAHYFKYLEFGTKMTRSRTSIKQRQRIMKTGVFHRAKNAGSPPWQGGSWAPTLRPAAIAKYPNLAAHIREAFGGML